MSRLNTYAYGRAHMLRALTSAGQFAHVPAEALSRALDELVDIPTRYRWNHEALAAHGTFDLIAECACSFREVLHPGRRTMAHRYTSATIDLIARREGVFCCLCGAVQPLSSRIRASGGSPGWVNFVCPTFLWPKGSFEAGRMSGISQPLCSPCLAASICAPNFQGVSREIAHPAKLALIFRGRLFRQRVEDNAAIWPTLRFDPRRKHERLAA